mmetsp:Transcript_3346/g.4567  ORF Transcript_3346/g.4567 Transcript_3346/m.4567 type:complete len:767 (-) Transcript_3346:70-2370(-)
MPFTKHHRNRQPQDRHHRDDRCDDVVPMGSFDFDHNVDKEKIARDRKKKGLCPYCGYTQTHQIMGVGLKLKRKPITNHQVTEGKCNRCYEKRQLRKEHGANMRQISYARRYTDETEELVLGRDGTDRVRFMEDDPPIVQGTDAGDVFAPVRRYENQQRYIAEELSRLDGSGGGGRPSSMLYHRSASMPVQSVSPYKLETRQASVSSLQRKSSLAPLKDSDVLQYMEITGVGRATALNALEQYNNRVDVALSKFYESSRTLTIPKDEDDRLSRPVSMSAASTKKNTKSSTSLNELLKVSESSLERNLVARTLSIILDYDVNGRIKTLSHCQILVSVAKNQIRLLNESISRTNANYGQWDYYLSEDISSLSSILSSKYINGTNEIAKTSELRRAVVEVIRLYAVACGNVWISSQVVELILKFEIVPRLVRLLSVSYNTSNTIDTSQASNDQSNLMSTDADLNICIYETLSEIFQQNQQQSSPSWDTVEKLKQSFTRSNGIHACLISMTSGENNKKVQEACCNFLKALTYKCDVRKEACIDAGCLMQIRISMQRHSANVSTLIAICSLLQTLAGNKRAKEAIGSLSRNLKNKHSIISLILMSMWQHDSYETLQLWACKALWSISVNAGNKDEIVQNDGIGAILNAMQSHVKSGKVQENACGVLSNIANTRARDHEGSLCYKSKIIEAGGLDKLKKLMIVHEKDEVLIDMATKTLNKLLNERTCVMFVNANMYHTLEKVARNSLPTSSCHERCLDMMEYMQQVSMQAGLR